MKTSLGYKSPLLRFGLRMMIAQCALVLVSLLAAGCGTVGYFGEYRGVVVDDADGKPLEGVSVSVLYIQECGFVLQSAQRVVGGAETFTDANGEFVIPSKNVSTPPDLCYYRSQPNMKIIKPYYHYLTYPYDSGPPVLDVYGNKHKPPVSTTKLVYRLNKLTDHDYYENSYYASSGFDINPNGYKFLPQQKLLLKEEYLRAKDLYFAIAKTRAKK